MRVKLFVLFDHQLTITPELADWVLAQNTTAFYAQNPATVIGKLKEKSTILGTLDSTRAALTKESKDNYFHTFVEDAVLIWSDFEMTEEHSETWGTFYLVTGEVNGLDEDTIKSLNNLRDPDTNRYFCTLAVVNATVDKLNELTDFTTADYSPSGVDSVWAHLFEKPVTEDTPAAKWREEGEKDPFGDEYNCPRSALPKGKLTDDELANAMFLCDHRTSLESIGWLTAGKERIRWLSRRLVEAEQRVAELEKNALQKDLPGQD